MQKAVGQSHTIDKIIPGLSRLSTPTIDHVTGVLERFSRLGRTFFSGTSRRWRAARFKVYYLALTRSSGVTVSTAAAPLPSWRPNIACRRRSSAIAG
jgi:hypothetical protein